MVNIGVSTMRVAFNACVAAVAMMALAVGLSQSAQAYERPGIWSGAYIGVNLGGTRLSADAGGFQASATDVSVGGHAGYNFQTGNFVLGIEGDLNYVAEGYYTASLRARAGVAMDNVLVYATGGIGYLFDSDVGDTGWVVGGGVEYMFMPNLIGRVEGLYTHVGNFDGLPVDISTTVVRAGVSYKF